MKQEDRYFRIDGYTGVTVAKQLHRGDKIIIGRNGQSTSLDTKYRLEDEQEKKLETLEENDVQTSKPKIMPLSWEDQVLASNEKVITPTLKHQSTPKLNLCESHPVVFKKFGEDGMRPPLSLPDDHDTKIKKESKIKKPSSSVKVKEGYAVKRRTAERVGIDGKSSRQNTHVTHISVSKENQGAPDQTDDVSYEDVLEMKIKSKSENGPHVHEEVSKAASSLGLDRLLSPPPPHVIKEDTIINHFRGRTNSPDLTKRLSSAGFRSESKTSVVSEGATNQKSILRSAGRGQASSRPSTFRSSSTSEIATNGMVSSTPPPKKFINQRTHSATATGILPGMNGSRKAKPPSASGQSRPPPMKPVLHKTSAASGSSIGGHKNLVQVNGIGQSGSGDAEYLHFSQQIIIVKDQSNIESDNKISDNPSNNHVIAEKESDEAIRSVTDHNKPTITKDVTFKDEVEFVDNIVKLNIKPEPEEEQNLEPSDVNTYAFDIPTADNELESNRIDTPGTQQEAKV